MSNAELLVVYEDDDQETAEFISTLNRHHALRTIQAPAGTSLGALRNLAVNSARSDVVVQWDDDDWYAAERLAIQLDAMEESRAAACLLSRWTIYDVVTSRAFISHYRAWEGSLMAQRGALGGYDDNLTKCEDTPVVEALLERGDIVFVDRPDLYVYVYHGRNTWDRGHWEEIFDASTPLSSSDAAHIAEQLNKGAGQVGASLPSVRVDGRQTGR